MRIGIDIRCLMDGIESGVQEYTHNFLQDVVRGDQENQYVLFANSFKGRLPQRIAWLEKQTNIEIVNFGFPNKLLNFLMTFLGWPQIDLMLGGVDVFFAPNISFLALSKKCRFVLTVHDLSFERFSRFFSLKRRLWHFVVNPRSLCRRANLVLAVSDSTRDDLVELYKIKRSKVKVFYPCLNLEDFYKPISPEIRNLVRTKHGLPKNFLFFLGTIEPRKNLVTLIQAFERIKELSDYARLRLVIAGRNGWLYKKALKKAQRSPFYRDIIFLGAVENWEKAALYQLSRALVYPSYFEGFGIPPLEAMACGCPVITSHTSSLPEVVEESALLVDPYRPEKLVQCLRIILDNPEIAERYSQRGKKRAVEVERGIREQDFLAMLRDFFGIKRGGEVSDKCGFSL